MTIMWSVGSTSQSQTEYYHYCNVEVVTVDIDSRHGQTHALSDAEVEEQSKERVQAYLDLINDLENASAGLVFSGEDDHTAGTALLCSVSVPSLLPLLVFFVLGMLLNAIMCSNSLRDCSRKIFAILLICKDGTTTRMVLV